MKARWPVVLGSTIGLMVSQGPLINFTFGVFLKPIVQEFGVGRGVAAAALTVSTFVTALTLPLTGRIVDRFGVRLPTILAALLVGLFLTLTGWLAHSILVFSILFGLLGIAASGVTPLPYLKAISAVYDRGRGFALALALAGLGLGTIVMPIIAQHLIGTVGWRGAYVGLGVLAVVLTIPVVLLFLPQGSGANVAVHGNPVALPGYTVAEALRTRAFYLLAASLFLGAGAVNGTIAHVVPLLTDRGMTPAQALSVMAMVGVSSIVGRIVCGFLLDRFWAPLVALISLGGAILGIALLAGDPALFTARIAVALLGFGLGVEADLVGFLVSRYLGLKAFGALFGIVFGAFMIATAVAPVAMGALFDVTGSYRLCLTIFVGFAAASAALLLALGSYAFPAVDPELEAAQAG